MNHFKFVIWLALLAILASCDPTRYRPETRSLKLESLEPEILTAPPGGSSTVVAILSSDSGFNGKVEFSLGSAPGWVSVDPKEVEVSLPPGGSRSVPLTLALSQEAVNGEYLLQVRAIYEKGWSNKDLRLRVSSDSTVSRPLRIERVEWGQTILLSNHALVGGKEALLRVHLVANEPLSLSRSLAGKVYLNGQVLGELFFSCPNPIPTETRQEDIASTCRVLLPKEWVVPGVVVELEMDPDKITPFRIPGGTASSTSSPRSKKGTTST
ncbi:putative peptidase M66 [Thermus phage phiLo]|nr:putative peptidase M66 [Thermus phage phiLo]